MQMVPRASGLAMDGADMMAAAVDAGGDYANADPMPCKGMTPACIDLMGCVVVLGAPIEAPSMVATAFNYQLTAYSFATDRLIGRTVGPELFPPILPA